jgi:hypothetical protein
MKELSVNFTGRGEVRGFSFEQLFAGEFYVYKVTPPSSDPHYEVFKRKINTQYDCISYPSANAFGIWAWTFPTLEQAKNKVNE